MKYNEKEFDSAVSYYEQNLKKASGKCVLIVSELGNMPAFMSLAPMSRALHNLKADVMVSMNYKGSEALNILKDAWRCYDDLKKGAKNGKTKALKEFINETNKRIKGNKFERIFKGPDLVIHAGKNGFGGVFNLKYDYKWFKKYKWDKLVSTSRLIWREVFDLKKNERLGMGFELVPTKKNLHFPLEDYLDSYAISWAMFLTAKNTAKINLGAMSARYSQLAEANRIGELKTTLIGCELEKSIDEPVFAKYAALSKALKLDRMKIADANFSITGKGYYGVHLFGERIGYPTLNKKSRWITPGQMIYKFSWSPQAEFETRAPKSRIGFTSTVPIDVLIESCNVDYVKMRRLNQKIADAIEGCDYIRVIGNKKIKGFKSDFTVFIRRKDGKGFREPKKSDADSKHKIDKEFFARTGKKVGTMANIPSGECFLTPDRVKGRIVGDVVISIDESMMINPNNPLVVDVDEAKGYKIISGEKSILKEFDTKKKECWKMLKEYEKNKSLPQQIIDLKRKNFNNVGEFAINTNPNAKLCRYLIVNEKIAKMIHVALGSGFDPDKSTEYHSDIVIDSPRQKMDIYAIRGGNKKWIIRKGRFVV